MLSLFKKKPLPKPKDFRSPLEKQLKSVKDRLAENFFKRVTHLANRPAVITLQEVRNSNPIVLETLKKGNYAIMQASEDSDSIIAIDTNQFEECKLLSLSSYSKSPDISDKIVAAHAKNKETKEEFIFLSTHIPGYTLEFPKDETLAVHINSIEHKLEFVFDNVLEIEACIQKIKAGYPHAKLVIQGDFNTYPDYFNSDLTPEISKKLRRLTSFPALKKMILKFIKHSKQPNSIKAFPISMNVSLIMCWQVRAWLAEFS